MAGKKNGQAGTPSGQAEQITKMEAVRRAVGELGSDAKNAAIQGWVRDRFGVEMSTNHVATYRSDLRRKAGGKGKPAAPKPAAPKAAAQKAVPTTKAPAAATITKQEAVRRALAELGPDAKPLAIQAYLRDRLGMEIKTDLISYYKKDAKGKAKAKGKATAGKPTAQPSAATKAGPKPKAPLTPAQAAPAPAAGGGKESGIPLDDILYIKQLVGRFGPGQLHTLVDAFAK